MKTTRIGVLVLRAGLPLALETAGLAALLWDTPQGHALAFAAGHGAASLGAMALWPYLPRVYREGQPPGRKVPDQSAEEVARVRRLEARRRRRRGRLLLALLVLFLPIFGLLGLLVAVLPALHRPMQERKRDWRRFAIPPLAASATEVAEQQSPVAAGQPLIEVIQSEDTTADERVAAVLALRHLPARTAVPILREGLRDASDDVRLLAYAMLDRRDAELQTRIQEHARTLERGGLAPGEQAPLHYVLAQLHWELVHSGLATGAVEGRALESAVRHGRAALEHAGQAGDGAGGDNQAATLFLLGRALLRQGALDEAARMLEQAREQGFADTSIRPFLAELAFAQRRFAEVSAHLLASRHRGDDRPGIVADLCRFWLAPGGAPEGAPGGRVQP